MPFAEHRNQNEQGSQSRQQAKKACAPRTDKPLSDQNCRLPFAQAVTG
jgi:hypothetical protein